jgi:hypothetical protein
MKQSCAVAKALLKQNKPSITLANPGKSRLFRQALRSYHSYRAYSAYRCFRLRVAVRQYLPNRAVARYRSVSTNVDGCRVDTTYQCNFRH